MPNPYATTNAMWDRYRRYLCYCPTIGLSLDISRMAFPAEFFEDMSGPLKNAHTAMARLEAGAIANADEGRQVGHYWLRAPEMAPDGRITSEIMETIDRVRIFAGDVRSGRIHPANRERFHHLLVIGIGGSALGPQLVCEALSEGFRVQGSGFREQGVSIRAGVSSRRLATASKDKRGEVSPALLDVTFCDNTDPDGFDRIFEQLGDRWAETLVLVISKSGGTKETRNGMLETAEQYRRAGLNFAGYAVAITGEGSELDRLAVEESWLARFPMWDWVGGRTSVTSAVGLLPAALCGIDVDDFLAGSREADRLTRLPIDTDTMSNPAALLALMWHHAGGGQGRKNMVVLPYKDRLQLLTPYLQQLVMESLGKKFDRQGKAVHQGLTVFGNKGSTDQHAYVQQLREGPDDFFVTFVEVLRDRGGSSMEVEPDATSGDYLFGFLQGTRHALTEEGRESMTLTLDDVSPNRIGAVIALFERAVGLYAELIDVNAYHQPGVEAGKKAAAQVLAVQRELLACLRRHRGESYTAEELAAALGTPGQEEIIYQILRHLSSNPERSIISTPATDLAHTSFSYEPRNSFRGDRTP